MTEAILERTGNLKLYRVDHKKSGDFTQIHNYSLYESANISGKAKLVLIICMSFPQPWKLNVKDLMKRTGFGEFSIRKCLRELEKQGYYEKQILRDDKGLFKGIKHYFYELPKTILERYFLRRDDEPQTGHQDDGHQTTSNIQSKQDSFSRNTSYSPSIPKSKKQKRKFFGKRKSSDDETLKSSPSKEENKTLEPNENLTEQVTDTVNDVEIGHVESSGPAPASEPVPPAPPEPIPGSLEKIYNFVKKFLPEKAEKTNRDDLMRAFREATYNGQNIDFNPAIARDLIKKSDPLLIQYCISVLPYRKITKGSPAGYLKSEIEAGGYPAPDGYESQYKKALDTKKYGKVLAIWTGEEYKSTDEKTARFILEHNIRQAYRQSDPYLDYKLKKTLEFVQLEDCFRGHEPDLIAKLKNRLGVK